MTVFNVAGLLREAPGAVREVRLRDRYLSLGPDVELAGPLDATSASSARTAGILVRGEIEAPAAPHLRALPRSRSSRRSSIRIAEEFLPSIDPETGAAVRAGCRRRRDSAHRRPSRDRPDSVIHEEFALTEPMHPLCRPDCPGLCPSAASGWTATTWPTSPTRSIRAWPAWRAVLDRDELRAAALIAIRVAPGYTAASH